MAAVVWEWYAVATTATAYIEVRARLSVYCQAERRRYNCGTDDNDVILDIINRGILYLIISMLR